MGGALWRGFANPLASCRMLDIRANKRTLCLTLKLVPRRVDTAAMSEVDRFKPSARSLEVDRPKGLIVVGYVTAIFMPPIGFILGIVAVTRPNRWAAKHGVGVIVTSILVPVLLIIVVTAGVNSAVKGADQEIQHSEQTSQEEFKRQTRRSQAEFGDTPFVRVGYGSYRLRSR